VPDQQEEEAQQQEEHPQFGLHTRNYDNDIKEMKLKMANLEVFLQGKINYWGIASSNYLFSGKESNASGQGGEP
jgi:hypothetical protein